MLLAAPVAACFYVVMDACNVDGYQRRAYRSQFDTAQVCDTCQFRGLYRIRFLQLCESDSRSCGSVILHLFVMCVGAYCNMLLIAFGVAQKHIMSDTEVQSLLSTKWLFVPVCCCFNLPFFGEAQLQSKCPCKDEVATCAMVYDYLPIVDYFKVTHTSKSNGEEVAKVTEAICLFTVFGIRLFYFSLTADKHGSESESYSTSP